MAVDQKVSKYMREHGPATDWCLAAKGAERAFNALREAIECEGYEVLHDASDDTYSVRARYDDVSEEAYSEASPAVQKAMRHYWRTRTQYDLERIKELEQQRYDAVAAEREACAFLAEQHTGMWDSATAEQIAKSIRERGSDGRARYRSSIAT